MNKYNIIYSCGNSLKASVFMWFSKIVNENES